MVPTRCRSSGAGSSTPASRCRTTPIGRSPRTPAWAAAIERGRAMVTGTTVPGNSTRLRTGTSGRTSAGSDCELDRRRRRFSSSAMAFSAQPSLRRVRVRQPCGELAPDQLVAARRQGDAPLEAAVRHLQAADHAGATRHRQRPLAGDDQAAHLRAAPRPGPAATPGRATWIQSSSVGLEHVDRRFPARRAARCAAGPEHVAMHPLGLIEQLQGLGPHPVRPVLRHRGILSTPAPASPGQWPSPSLTSSHGAPGTRASVPAQSRASSH